MTFLVSSKMSLSTPAIDPLQQAYSDHLDHGSVGPAIAVLVAIAVLGAIAVIIGRICSGRGLMGRCYYDFEGWVETKCGSCIDGRVDPPVVAESGGSGTDTPVSETVEETEEEEAFDQQGNMHA